VKIAVSIVNFKKFSLRLFLNQKITTLDFSNNFIEDFTMFDNLPNLVSFELRKVYLQTMQQINFGNFKQLAFLDLSQNNLSRLDFESFEFLNKLEHLDLSFNQISSIDSSIFSVGSLNVSKTLKYLNLENNKIISIDGVFINYLNLEFIKLSNNYLSGSSAKNRPFKKIDHFVSTSHVDFLKAHIKIS
jgi:Leucine-rich repeat (LRR) protein